MKIRLLILLLFLHLEILTAKEVVLTPVPKGGDFSLNSVNGVYSLHQSKGKVVLLYFGFTSCPDVCPTTLSNVSSAFKRLSKEELQNVQMLFISIDPERDDLKKLQKYSSHFHEQILALTGSISELKKVTILYGAFFNKVQLDSGLGYTMDHSAKVFVIDKKGNWISSISHGASPKDFHQSIIDALKK